MLDGCTAFGRTAFGHTAFGHTASGHASGVGALGHALAMRCDIYIYIVRYHRCTVLASPFMPVSEALGEANHITDVAVFLICINFVRQSKGKRKFSQGTTTTLNAICKSLLVWIDAIESY